MTDRQGPRRGWGRPGGGGAAQASVGGCPLHRRVMSSIPGTSPLEASGTPPQKTRTTNNISRRCQVSPLANHPSFANHWFNLLDQGTPFTLRGHLSMLHVTCVILSLLGSTVSG